MSKLKNDILATEQRVALSKKRLGLHFLKTKGKFQAKLTSPKVFIGAIFGGMFIGYFSKKSIGWRIGSRLVSQLGGLISTGFSYLLGSFFSQLPDSKSIHH